MVLLKYSFCEDICEKRDSAQCDTGWSQTLRSITLCGVGKLKCPRIQIGLKLRGVNQFDLILTSISRTMCAQSSTLRSVTHCRVQLRAVSHCTELTFKIYRRSKMVSHCMESNSAQCDSARSFAEGNFVFAALSLPWLRILNFFLNIRLILQHCPTFKKNILKGKLIKKNSNIFAKMNF